MVGLKSGRVILFIAFFSFVVVFIWRSNTFFNNLAIGKMTTIYVDSSKREECKSKCNEMNHANCMKAPYRLKDPSSELPKYVQFIMYLQNGFNAMFSKCTYEFPDDENSYSPGSAKDYVAPLTTQCDIRCPK